MLREMKQLFWRERYVSWPRLDRLSSWPPTGKIARSNVALSLAGTDTHWNAWGAENGWLDHPFLADELGEVMMPGKRAVTEVTILFTDAGQPSEGIDHEALNRTTDNRSRFQ